MSNPDTALRSDPSTWHEKISHGGNMLNILGNFGIRNAVKAAYARYSAQETSEATLIMHPRQLSYPLFLRPTLSDMYGYGEIFSQEVYHLPEQIKDRVGDKPIVDLGAYNGDSSSYFASTYPGSAVIAVEPYRGNIDILGLNSSPYGNQISVVDKAVTAVAGAVPSELLGGVSNDMLHVYTPDASGENMDAESLTPDDIIDMVEGKEIGIVKVDIEGAERALFNSAAIDQLLRRTGVLLAETHDQFAPGTSHAVWEAAHRNGLKQVAGNRHTDMFIAY